MGRAGHCFIQYILIRRTSLSATVSLSSIVGKLPQDYHNYFTVRNGVTTVTHMNLKVLQ